MQTLNIFQSLLFIQDKHAGYFYKHQKNIMNFIQIDWKAPLHVALTEDDLPIVLKKDIETLILPINNMDISI